MEHLTKGHLGTDHYREVVHSVELKMYLHCKVSYIHSSATRDPVLYCLTSNQKVLGSIPSCVLIFQDSQ